MQSCLPWPFNQCVCSAGARAGNQLPSPCTANRALSTGLSSQSETRTSRTMHDADSMLNACLELCMLSLGVLQVAERADVPLAKHLVASVCKRCGCSQSPTTVTNVCLTHLRDKQKQRAWRQSRHRTRNPAEWSQCVAVQSTCQLCRHTSVTTLASEQEATRVRLLKVSTVV